MIAGAVPAVIPPAAACPDDPLYVIFTSGSTGSPKGAMVSNRSAVNRIQWMCGKYFSPETVVMLKTPYTFDVSVWEIFGFALGGFTLYILPPEDHYRQDRVIEHIRRGKVTDIHFVPAVFGHFLDTLRGHTPQGYALFFMLLFMSKRRGTGPGRRPCIALPAKNNRILCASFHSGRVTVICRERPSAVEAWILPLWEETMAWAMESPRPWPPVRELRDGSVR